MTYDRNRFEFFQSIQANIWVISCSVSLPFCPQKALSFNAKTICKQYYIGRCRFWLSENNETHGLTADRSGVDVNPCYTEQV
jgi:hypothetical protein